MSVLLTAFKGIHNSSYQLIRECEKDKVYLTNSYDGIDKDIDKIDFSPYSAVIMFGLDTRLKDKIRIEPQAILDGTAYRTIYDVSKLTTVFELKGLQATVAKRATSYLCNYAYYHVLEIMNGRAIFIHIPPERFLTETMQHRIRNVIETISDLL
ncbi:MAG: hypothetical protein PHV32_01165 [Eubacteriales bacterium]|nr:hypothetical protein [Eubacteriales bacterium]